MSTVFCFTCDKLISTHAICKVCNKGYIAHRDYQEEISTMLGKIERFTVHYEFCSSVLCNYNDRVRSRIFQ